MQHSPSTSACRPRPRVHATFLHLQCANRPFWTLASKYTISQLLAFTTKKIATPTAEMMSILSVAIFLVVNASSSEKNCLQFSIPTWRSGLGGEGAVLHRPKRRPNTDTSPQNFQHIFFGPRFSENLSTSWATSWKRHGMSPTLQNLFFQSGSEKKYVENFYLYLSHTYFLISVLHR